MIIPAISPQSDAFAALPDVKKNVDEFPPSGWAAQASIFDGRAKNEQWLGQQKSHCHARQRRFTIILVYSIVPYLRQKVQENRYFTRFLPVIHNFLHPVDNYYFSSWAGATAGAVAINL